MRTILNSRGLMVALGLLVTASVAGCAARPAASVAAAGPTPTPAATVNARPTPVAAASQAATPPAAPSATPTGTGGIQNLVISSAEKAELAAAFVATAYPNTPAADLGYPVEVPGTTYYAFDPATDTWWAMATFEPTAPYTIQSAYPDGTSVVTFRKVGAGIWQAGMAGTPLVCGEIDRFPPAVLQTWGLPTASPLCTSPS
jgi:hypothetical protein